MIEGLIMVHFPAFTLESIQEQNQYLTNLGGELLETSPLDIHPKEDSDWIMCLDPSALALRQQDGKETPKPNPRWFKFSSEEACRAAWDKILNHDRGKVFKGGYHTSISEPVNNIV